jgi:uncharacterized protein YndB with AHSA1/START domain
MPRRASSGQVVSKTITINAPVEVVWATLTSPTSMKAWMSDAEIDLTVNWIVGGPMVVRGELHGVSYENRGTILQYEPHSVLRYSYWTSLSRLPDRPENHSVVEFRLSAVDDHTELTLTHSVLRPETTDKHSAFYWSITLGGIKKLIENG